MNQSNSLNLFRSPEIIEHVSEVFYLLNFFSKTQLQQWAQVPSEFSPVWVELGAIHCNTDSSIHFLTLIFSGRIDLNLVEPYIFIFNETIKLIFYEISGLLDDWILNTYYDFVFLKRSEDEIMNPDRIWLVLSRLCKIALSYEDWGKYQINELSFEYFVKKYTHPYDPI
jgi:hypothetical protein